MVVSMLWHEFIKSITSNDTSWNGYSEWRVISQDMVNQFADVTGDYNLLHIGNNVESLGTFKGGVAHGFLLLSLLSSFGYEVFSAMPENSFSVNYGFDRIRFMHPVYIGAKIRAYFKLYKYDLRLRDQIFLFFDSKIEIENSPRLALKARWIIAIKKTI